MKKIRQINWKELFQKKSQMVFTIGIISFILFSLLGDYFHHLAQPVKVSSVSDSPDTVIPKGFVLVPVDLKNADSLSALIENFAIVDLYVASTTAGRNHGQKVGHHLRLLRAPLNPNTFAVLVPDNEANTLINGSGPLVAVIQNRDQIGHGTIEKSIQKVHHVQYYHGGSS